MQDLDDAIRHALAACDERDAAFERLTAELEERKQVAVAFAQKDAKDYAKYLKARRAWDERHRDSPYANEDDEVAAVLRNNAILDAYFNPAKEG